MAACFRRRGVAVLSPERLYREHRDAFELPEEIFQNQYRLPKIVVRWLCDELSEEPEERRRGWIHFPETPSERFDAERGFRLLGRIAGVIGCVDGTMVSIVCPSKNDSTVTKAAYWCRKYFYALNVMVVCDADCRIMCIDPLYPGSVHDSFVWQFSWLRNQLEQGQLPRDGRFLLGDSSYPLEPWLITPVLGNHATSTACGRFNKAHSSCSITSALHRASQNRSQTPTLKCQSWSLSRARTVLSRTLRGQRRLPSGWLLPALWSTFRSASRAGERLRGSALSPGSEPAADVPVRSVTSKESAAITVVPTTRDTVGKPLSALATVVPSMDAVSDWEPLATTTEVLTTKDPVTSLPSVKPSPWKP
ncbi:hypothetical protein ISCGN_009552 [Ixodes scapularis]